MEETKYWVWLNMVFGTGNHRIWEIMSFFRTAEKAYLSLSTDSSVVSLNENENKNVHSVQLSRAESFITNCTKRGIGVISITSPEYPEQLRHIYNPPSVLYYKGNIGCLQNEMTVTAVGTRKASSYSLKAAKEICSELSARGAVIISGFAVGIDLACSMAAVDMGRPTVCVMGCGVDVDYPRQNFSYRDAILSAGGVFLSEFPPATQPNSPNFPKRNRILAALGKAAIVFQAGAKSGSLITANLAAGQGRDVLCLPPADIFSGDYAGNIKLLRDGALPMYDASDVIDSITGKRSVSPSAPVLSRESEKDLLRTNISEAEIASVMEHINNNITDDVRENTVSDDDLDLPNDLTEQQRRISEELMNGAMHADELASRLEIDSSELMTELTELEIFGIVRSLPGKMYELIR
ncbi:DNA-processing protein DprA [Ruminococcus sp.]|uniref:DNA-processing protein DprA n=1 Tax=Ruminococcus sp. TaxID=41978 RepID=UPI0025F5A5CE|nr:DNA-processing protein DprA [Ruminococcus sp.]MCR4638148.1 DNA-processing protein DprA [Ruminococcus sp.]